MSAPPVPQLLYPNEDAGHTPVGVKGEDQPPALICRSWEN